MSDINFVVTLDDETQVFELLTDIRGMGEIANWILYRVQVGSELTLQISSNVKELYIGAANVIVPVGFDCALAPILEILAEYLLDAQKDFDFLEIGS